MTTTAWARSVAIGCLNTRSHEYQQLSSEMCWNAAFHVALLAGCISQAKAAQLKDATSSAGGPAFANGAPIRNAEDMLAVPGGHFIYFMFGARPIHAMVSTGAGMAAGNKNDCVGVGHGVGWEELDLANGLKWGGAADITAPGGPGGRAVHVFQFPITALANR